MGHHLQRGQALRERRTLTDLVGDVRQGSLPSETSGARKAQGQPEGMATVTEVHLCSPRSKAWGAAQSGWGKERHTPPTACRVRLPWCTRESLPGMARRVARRQGRPAPQAPRPCGESEGAEESACGKATGRAKALRERGGKRDNGPQGTRKLSTMAVVESWRNGRHHTFPLS